MRTASFACVLALSASSAMASVTNGGFELGTGDNADNWNQLEIMAGTLGATANADRSNANPHSGDYAMDLSVLGAPDYGPVAEIQQQLAVGSVIGGQSYDFSFWGTGNLGPGSVAFYEVLWFDGDASDGGGPQGSATGLQSFALSNTYAEYAMTGLIAPTTADTVLIQIRLVTGAFDGAIGNMTVDDVTFSAVPTPASAVLFGLGGFVATRRRRA